MFVNERRQRLRHRTFRLATVFAFVALAWVFAGCSQPKPATAVVAPAVGSRTAGRALPVVSVQIVEAAAASGTASEVFAIQRAGDLTQPLAVNYRVSGTAVNGVDYARLSGTVDIAAGQSSAQIGVAPLGGSASAASKTVTLTLVPPNQPFTLVALPDTQHYSNEGYGATRDIFTAQTQWIVEQKDKLNIVFVLHEGDVTDGNTVREWTNAKTSMRLLDGVVPYALALGNHDGDANSTLLNRFFPMSQFQNLPTFGGVFEYYRLGVFSRAGPDYRVDTQHASASLAVANRR